MAEIQSPNLSIRRVGTASGTSGEIDYSYTVDWAPRDVDEDLWHVAHAFLWERDGNDKDYLHARYNGTRATVWRDTGNDEFISHVNSRWTHPGGDSSTSVSGTKRLDDQTMMDELGAEEYYLHVCLHPAAGANVETYSNEAVINF